jgi:hypothetical protein
MGQLAPEGERYRFVKNKQIGLFKDNSEELLEVFDYTVRVFAVRDRRFFILVYENWTEVDLMNYLQRGEKP